jgi:hypothetical protein
MSDITMETCQNYHIELTDYCKNKINTKNYSKNGVTYGILNYNKDIICHDDTKSGIYRSIITALPENKILGFSPIKSIEIEKFQEKFEVIDSSIYINEIIEGTMINLFYDDRVSRWEISTKSAVGGNYFYFRNQYYGDTTKTQTSFYRMFLDALRADEMQELNDLPVIKEFDKNYSYSFVLQHPDNHIVLPISEPKAYLVAVYYRKDNIVTPISALEYEEWDFIHSIVGIINFPKRVNHEFTTYDEYKSKYCSVQNDYSQTVGIMFTNIDSGIRSSMHNPTYETMKILRGNNPNIQYQYLCLRKTQKVKEFLSYFYQYKRLFFNFYTDCNNFINNLHTSYVTYYVKKQNVQISKKYFPHIYKIHHNIYLPSLARGEPVIIRRRVVQDYFDSLEPKEMLYSLNYDNRLYAENQEKLTM